MISLLWLIGIFVVVLLIILVIIILCYVKRIYCFKHSKAFWNVDRPEFDYQCTESITAEPLMNEELDLASTWHENELFDESDSSTLFAESIDEHEADKEINIVKLNQFLKKYDNSQVKVFGYLAMKFHYIIEENMVEILLHHSLEFPVKPHLHATTPPIYQISLAMVPKKKQHFKTKQISGMNPIFKERIILNNLLKNNLTKQGVRIRLYLCKNHKRFKLIAESEYLFYSLFERDNTITGLFPLETSEPKLIQKQQLKKDIPIQLLDSVNSTQAFNDGSPSSSNQSEIEHKILSSASAQILSYRPELFVGISYSKLTGRLTLEIVKGSYLNCGGHIERAYKNKEINYSKKINSFIKVNVQNQNNQKIQKFKTRTFKNQSHPYFKETFIHLFPANDLPNITLVITAYNQKQTGRNEFIGWTAIGRHSTGDEENGHWLDMQRTEGEMIYRWHLLHSLSSTKEPSM